MVQQVKWKSAPAPSTHSPFPVGRGGQLESMEASVNDHFTNRYTKQLQLLLEERRKRKGESLGRQVSSESFILFLSFSLFYFNFYFNWNNIIPRSSHELRLTQRQHTSCANGVRLFGVELGLLVSATVAGCLSRSPQSPSLPVFSPAPLP